MPALKQKPSDEILATKLNPPLVPADIIDRPHLCERLEKNALRPLTLISAPAGYGKSTLAAQWIETSSLPAAWISLGESDNDPRRFLQYIVAAVRSHESKACAEIHALLGAQELPPSDVLGKLLSNDLERVSKPFVLVLDDYHLITNPDIHDLLDGVLRHPPKSLHLAIVTRRDPPFSLVTMMAHGLVSEIRETDLQFDEVETVEVLKRAADIRLDEDGITRIMDEIEGWITGLRLFCLAAEKGVDPKVFLLGIKGGASHIQDYLVEQVFARQDPELQECLLKTSILDRFCAPLCEAICGHTPGKETAKGKITGQRFIEIVAEAKLFGIQLDPGGKWIRYHHLFQALLLSHLQRKWDSKDIAALHRRAAKWFAAENLIDEALKHAAAAGDNELAADIIEDARFDALNEDKWPLLGKWLDSLPPGIENSRAHLLMGRAYVLIHSIRIDELPQILERVVELEGETPSDPILLGEIEFFRGILTFFLGDIKASKKHFAAALRTTPEINWECRAESEYFSNVVLHLEGQPAKAINGLNEAIKRNESRNLFYQTRLVFGLSFVNALSGNWPESFRAAEHLLEFALPNDFAYAVAWSGYMKAIASVQMLDLEEANRGFEFGYERRYIKNRRAAIDCLFGRALCRQLQGKADEADECLQEAREFAFWTGDPANLDIVDSGRARIALLRGDIDVAYRWLAGYHHKPFMPVRMFFLEFPEMTVCQVLVARGTPLSLKQASVKLEQLENESREFHHYCHLVPILVMKSLISYKSGEKRDALDILAEAVKLSWPGRWILPFIEGGAPVAELLTELPKNHEWGGFVTNTLARFDLDNPPRQQSAEGADEVLVEPLTNRELDVLELICERDRDKEIAERLFISTSTVKTHLTHIYGKLGVNNRREAAKEAKRLGLV